jgi:HSP20 family molecular chaperone IbpA
MFNWNDSNRYSALNIDNWFPSHLYGLAKNSDASSRHDSKSGYSSLSYEAKEDDEGLTLSVDLPGTKSSDLQLEAVSNLVKIWGKQKGKDFAYEYSLSKAYDPTTCHAKLEDGVLTLKFKKFERPKQKVHKISLA